MPDTIRPEPSPVSTAAGKRRPPRFLAVALGLVVGLPLAAGAALLAWSALVRADPAALVPAGYKAYASAPSAGNFVRGVLDLKALDAALSSRELGAARSLVRTLRAAPFLRSALFDRAAGFRVDAALYDGGAFVAVASLGYRSAALRLAPLAIRLAPRLLAGLPGLSLAADAAPARFELAAGESTLYGMRYRDALVIASTEALLAEAAKPDPARVDPALAEALGKRGDGSVRFFTRPAALLGSSADPADGADDSGAAAEPGPAEALLSRLDLSPLAAVELSLADDRLAVSADMDASTEDEGLKALLGRRSRTPSILSRLPESASYYSLLSAGRPAELWEALAPALDGKARDSYRAADEASRAAFGLGLDALLFSWMGDELGAYGSALGAEPVFFVSVADEKARRGVFEKAFGSLVVGRDISAMVGDTRVPRVVFPRFIRSFLETVGVRLVEPFYLVEDGFLYVSQSAELLVACAAETRMGKLLVKTDRWKEASRGVSPESSASIFYSLDRSAPFFMRGSSGLRAVLALYGRGVAAVRLSDGSMRLELSAVPSRSQDSALAPLPGFPARAGSRMSSDPVVGRSPSGAPMAYWTGGAILHAVELSSGARFGATMDDPGWLALDAPDGRIAAVWAVSERGTVYRMDARLEPLAGFPLVTGQRVSGPPSVSGGRLVAPVASEPSLMLVSPDASTRFSGALGARPRSRTAVSSHALAALPRSFDSELYLMDLDGVILPGWPAGLPGLASAAPAFAGDDAAASGLAVAITEAGALHAYLTDATPAPGFPVPLLGTFDAAPVWAPGWRALFIVSIEGTLWKIGPDGTTLGSVSLGRGQARDGAVVAFDSDGDGREELYVSGGGDALYAFSGDLSPLPGFPVSGSGPPAFVDVNGDGSLDLVARGADDTLRAYSGR